MRTRLQILTCLAVLAAPLAFSLPAQADPTSPQQGAGGGMPPRQGMGMGGQMGQEHGEFKEEMEKIRAEHEQLKAEREQLMASLKANHEKEEALHQRMEALRDKMKAAREEHREERQKNGGGMMNSTAPATH